MSIFKVAVLIVSSKGAAGKRTDEVGPALTPVLSAAGFDVMPTRIVADSLDKVMEELIFLSDEAKAQLILTSGGTGLSPDDLTPEATETVATRLIPGIAEAMRSAGRLITPYADLSRAVAAQRGHSLIINLPGSPKGALENLKIVMPVLFHALEKIAGDPSDCAR